MEPVYRDEERRTDAAGPVAAVQYGIVAGRDPSMMTMAMTMKTAISMVITITRTTTIVCGRALALLRQASVPPVAAVACRLLLLLPPSASLASLALMPT